MRALLAAVVVTAATPVLAQVPYQIAGPLDVPFVPLAEGAPAPVGTNESVQLPFPFIFGTKRHTTVAVSLHGYLTFTGSGSVTTNLGFPYIDSSAPQEMVAVWWDTLFQVPGTAVRVQTQGTEPLRRVVIEWRDVAVASSTGPKVTFQAILYESTNQIRLAYAPLTQPSGVVGSASVGVLQAQGHGLSLLGCTTSAQGSCDTGSFPASSNSAGRAIDVFYPPDLSVESIRADDVGYAGVLYRYTAQLKNAGGRVALRTRVRFYLSSDPYWDATDEVLGEADPVDVPAMGIATANGLGTLSTSRAQGDCFVIARVDPDGALQELNETDNTSRPLSIKVGAATPDLFVDALQTSATTAAAGQTVEVTRSVYNLGNAGSPAEVRYTYFLSRNEVASTADIALGATRSLAAIAPNLADTATETVKLPGACGSTSPSDPCVNAGLYWIGVCVDHDAAATPTGTLAEINEVNNCGALSNGILIGTGELTIVSPSTREIAQFATVLIPLSAVGGDGAFVWSLAAGTLPPGFSLKPSGELVGAASKAGTFAFDVKVASDSETKTQSFSLKVVSANLPLAIADQQLPAAQFGSGYEEIGLVAVGGTPPYRWSLAKDSRLPAGLALSKDGRIEGRPAEVRQLPFTVELTDSAGVRATKNLEITVLQPSSLQITTPGLNVGTLGVEYAQPLQVLGGHGPYVWSVVSFQPMAEGLAGQPGSITRDTFPQDFGVRLDKFGESWALRGVPAKAGLFSVTLKVLDTANGSDDFTSFPLRVNADRALAITTTSLPDAFVNQPYASGLSHNGGTELKVTFSSACVPQVDGSMLKWGCTPADPTQQLPNGLTLNEKGELRGTPTLPSDLPADGALIYAFLVKVEDDAGRQDLRSLSIKLRPDFTSEKSGCNSTGAAPAVLTLLALTGLGLRRSRRSSRRSMRE